MVLVGATYQNNMVFIMAFLLFSFGIIAMVQTHHNLDGLIVESLFIEPGFAHTKGRARLRVKTRKKKPLILTVFETKEIKITSDLIVSGHPNLLEGPVSYGKRGAYNLKKIKVKTIYPYGLFVAWQWHPISTTYFVYPERFGSQLYTFRTSRDGEDFSGHKKFRDGDSLRHVDWKAFARERPLLLKEFHDGNSTTHLFDFDKVLASNTEQKLSQLSKWISETYSNRNNFGLILKGKIIPASNGTEHFHRCLRELAKYEEAS